MVKSKNNIFKGQLLKFYSMFRTALNSRKYKIRKQYKPDIRFTDKNLNHYCPLTCVVDYYYNLFRSVMSVESSGKLLRIVNLAANTIADSADNKGANCNKQVRHNLLRIVRECL